MKKNKYNLSNYFLFNLNKVIKLFKIILIKMKLKNKYTFKFYSFKF